MCFQKSIVRNFVFSVYDSDGGDCWNDSQSQNAKFMRNVELEKCTHLSKNGQVLHANEVQNHQKGAFSFSPHCLRMLSNKRDRMLFTEPTKKTIANPKRNFCKFFNIFSFSFVF